MKNETYHRVSEVAKILALSHGAVLRFIREGRIKAVKIRGPKSYQYRIAESQLMKFLDGRNKPKRKE